MTPAICPVCGEPFKFTLEDTERHLAESAVAQVANAEAQHAVQTLAERQPADMRGWRSRRASRPSYEIRTAVGGSERFD